jgi:penicillin-binding protein 1C
MSALIAIHKRLLGHLCLGGLAIFVWLWCWLHAYVGEIDTQRLRYSPYLLDDQGDLLHVLLAKDERLRIPTTFADVDGHYVDLLMAYEDQRYWQHKGVDWLAMLRAAYQLLSNGQIVSGASTLTMQSIRLLEPKPRTVIHKLDQIRKAIALERIYTKQEILGIYLSLAPFGSNIEGVNSASLVWFNKWPQDLTPAEAALLVALPQSPETRRPDRYPAQAVKARQRVLARAVEKQVISIEYMAIAELSPVPVRQHKLAKHAPHTAWFHVNNNIQQPQTTINRDMQLALSNMATDITLAPNLNLSIIVAESHTGAIKAYIGSQNYYDFMNHGAVDYSRAIRSPGSTLKPFIYALAQANGNIAFETIIDDRAIDLKGYQPKNMTNKAYGQVSITEALQRSLNIPAVKVLNRFGTEKFAGKLAGAGIELRNGEGLPIALGGAGLTLVELVSLYTALGNQGKVIKPITVKQKVKSEQALLPAETANQINWILSNNTGGNGRLHGAHKTQAVAYKTGTGPGGSDAWAIGSNGDYTVGVWVGTPDGNASFGNTGLSAAVPIFNRALDILPRGNLSITKPQQPPSSLTFFDRKQSGLKALYPIDGSVLHMAQKQLRIPIEIDQAKYPIWISINNKELVQLSSANQYVTIKNPGGYELAIVDSNHQSTSMHIHVE